MFRCCVPWCGARAAAPADEADHALREGSPHLVFEISKYWMNLKSIHVESKVNRRACNAKVRIFSQDDLVCLIS